MKGLAFLAAGSLLFALHLQRRRSRTADDARTWRARPGATRWWRSTLSVAVLGLGGLPPLAGFMSKWQIFVAGFRVGSTVGGLAGGLRRPQQRAVAGVLRAAGECRLPP